MKGNVIVLWLGILSEWTRPVAADDGDERCTETAVMSAMTSCQGERQQLSTASQTNSTALLCRALQLYSDCMRPKIDGCQGAANAAFTVIQSKYASEPFNCRLTDSTSSSSTTDESKSGGPDGTILHNVSAHGSDVTGPSNQQPYVVDAPATTRLTSDVTQEAASTTEKVEDPISHSNTPAKKSFDPHNTALTRAPSMAALVAVTVHCLLVKVFL